MQNDEEDKRTNIPFPISSAQMIFPDCVLFPNFSIIHVFRSKDEEKRNWVYYIYSALLSIYEKKKKKKERLELF